MKKLKRRFSWEFIRLDRIKGELVSVEAEMKQATNYDQKEKARAEILFLQRSLANSICLIVYSQEIFPYMEGSYSFKNVTEQQRVNCMVRTELVHLLCKQYGLGDTLAVSTKNHIFPILPLVNDTYLSMDANISLFDPKDPDSYPGHYAVGKHEEVYMAGLLQWKAEDFFADNPKIWNKP